MSDERGEERDLETFRGYGPNMEDVFRSRLRRNRYLASQGQIEGLIKGYNILVPDGTYSEKTVEMLVERTCAKSPVRVPGFVLKALDFLAGD